MRSRLFISFVALASVLGACGGTADEAASTVASTTPSTTLNSAEPGGPVTFESEPIQAGPMFGSGAATNTFDDTEQADPCIDCEPQESEPDFAPALEDEPFCTLLADLEQRPFPSDETEALVVAHAWISELREVATADVGVDLDVFIDFLDTAIASQGQIGLDDANDAVDAASDRMDNYVDAQCYGRGTPAPEQEEGDGQQPAAALVVIDGVEIPEIRFSGRAQTTPSPYFGDDLDIGAAGSENRAADAFCRAVHSINNRPQPTEDLEEIRVAGANFDAIAPLVPDELTDEFAVIADWIQTLVGFGSLDDFPEPAEDAPILIAVDSVNAYVAANCSTA